MLSDRLEVLGFDYYGSAILAEHSLQVEVKIKDAMISVIVSNFRCHDFSEYQ